MDRRARAGVLTSTLRRLACVAGVLAAYGAARLAFNIVGLRTIGAEAVGAANLALSFGMLLSLPAASGVAPTYSRYLPLVPGGDFAGAARLRAWAVRTAFVWTAPFAAAFVLAGDALGVRNAGPGFRALAVGWTALYALYMLNRSDLFALGRAGTALGIEVAGLALFLLALCGIALTGGFYGIPFSVYYLPSALFLLWGLRPRGTGSASLPFARGELMRVALFALAGSVVSLGISYLTTIVVGSSSGIAKAGLWATLLSIAAPILLVPRTLNSYFLPRLSLMGSRSAEAFRALSRLHQRGSSLLALVCVGAPLVLTRETIAWGVGGTGDPGLALSWRFLCAASYGIFRGEPLITAVGALGYTGLTAAVSAVSGALCVGIWLALLPAGGLPAVAAGSAAFSILAPVLIAAASRLRTEKLHPPVELLPADGVFILICALSFAGALESALPQAFALGAMLAVAAAGGFGLRRRAEALRAELAVQADVVFPVDLAAPPPGPVRP